MKKLILTLITLSTLTSAQANESTKGAGIATSALAGATAVSLTGTISAPTETTSGETELEVACQIQAELEIYSMTDGKIIEAYLGNRLAEIKESYPEVDESTIIQVITNETIKTIKDQSCLDV